MPRVLIDTTTGRLHDRTQLAETFEALPVFSELVLSMTTEERVDYARIWREVKEFYRYVMFSHRWEHGEPLFQNVEHITVYELEASPANTKLQTFCSLVHSLGFRWAGVTHVALTKTTTWYCKSRWLPCSLGIAVHPSHSFTFAVSRRSHRNPVVSTGVSETLEHGHIKNTWLLRGSSSTLRTGNLTLG